jgi:hypothetical protein
VVAYSIAEAKYIAMTLSAAKMIWLRSILVELNMNQTTQMNLCATISRQSIEVAIGRAGSGSGSGLTGQVSLTF